SSDLEYVEVRYGGGYSANAAVMDKGQGNLKLINSTVRDSYTNGLRIEHDDATVSNATFLNNNGAAVSMDLSSNPTITLNQAPTGDGVNGLLLDGGPLTKSLTWNNPGVVYQLSNDVTVPAAYTLTVGADQVIKSHGPALIVNGTLTANGTAGHPV